MESNHQFDAQRYFEHLAKTNRLARQFGFRPCFCAGPEGIEGVMQEFRTQKNFIMIDDTSQQNTFSRGVSFFDRNVYTVFILAGYRMDDMRDREEKLRLCRRIFRQFHSRLIADKASMRYADLLEYLDVKSIFSKELPNYAMNGVTGLYFMLNNEEPVDLTYNQDEWDE